jgi:hypothetical protein
MAVAYITEFAEMQPMTTAGGLGSAVLWPKVADQNVAIGAGSLQSSAFNTLTRMIRVNVDVSCAIEIGGNPDASIANTRMSANSTEYFGVRPGSNLKLAVIAKA